MTAKTIRVALLGFGTVGQGIFEMIEGKKSALSQLLNAEIEVPVIFVRDGGKKRGVPASTIVTNQWSDLLKTPNIDVVVEAIVGEEPAATYVSEWLGRGIPVITANKEMFSLHGERLKRQAQDNHTYIGYEATTAGSIPVIRTISQLLKVNRIHKVEGILNGTTNYMLTYMREQGKEYEVALEKAQQLGYAEADPTNDVDGFDAFYKLMILCETIYGSQPVWNEVERRPLGSSLQELVPFVNEKLRLKYIASAELVGDRIIGSIRPTLVGPQHPLFAVEGVDNAIIIHTDLSGELTLRGPGAGKTATASIMLEELVAIFAKENIPFAHNKG
ncbi:homoserine dehydrogenase [Cytobacillus spongiae]|uniref:homoserine dehydrogenase n=1 Tax=Cytobacillus spongiae TaxID=2901381 RepID=UPI001F41D025|nr:homoserine dehydrogenase [Cytobacillus spongiae]UII56736.1 homoserine dehydrogenase [Cytobacillus spongiae]